MHLNLLLISRDNKLRQAVQTALSSLDAVVEQVNNVSSAWRSIEARAFQCLLVDCRQLEPAEYQNLPEDLEVTDNSIPVVILADAACEPRARKAVGLGAQDYELIDNLEHLSKAVVCSIDRFGLMQAAFRAQERGAIKLDSLEKDLTSLLSIFYFTKATATGSAMGLTSLQQADPDSFRSQVQEYCALMEMSLVRAGLKISPEVSTHLSDMAKRLGTLRAGPRDVIEIYGMALRAQIQNVPAAKAKAYSDLALLMALELMGYLVSYYRNVSRTMVS